MKKIEKIILNVFFGLSILLSSLTPTAALAQVDTGVWTVFTTVVPAVVSANPPGFVAVGNEINSGTAKLLSDMNEEEGKYRFIVPLGPFSSFTGEPVDLRTGTALVDYLRTWFKFLIGIGGIIGVVRLVMVGFTIVTSASSVDAKSKIRGELSSIIVALLMVAGSWVFLNTINPQLVNTSLLIGKTTATTSPNRVIKNNSSTPDAEVVEGIVGKGFYYVIADKKTNLKSKIGPYTTPADCKADADANRAVVKPEDGTISTECYDHTTYNVSLTETESRNYLREHHIYANKNACTYASQTSCTNIDGLSKQILDSVINLASNCCGGQTSCTLGSRYDMGVCPVLITGGTEAGHQSHGLSAPNTLDLRFTAKVETFLKDNADAIAPSFSRNIRYRYNNVWFTDEIYGSGTRHFHVCAETSSPSLSSPTCGNISDLLAMNKRCTKSEDEKQTICR